MVDSPLVFVSYAHKDLEWLEELRSHLGPHLRVCRLCIFLGCTSAECEWTKVDLGHPA